MSGAGDRGPEHRVRRVLEGLLGVPATEGNRVDVLRNGDEIFPAMLEAIQKATHTVDFCTYVYWSGDISERFAHALADRARAGVRVRVLLDAVGAAPMSRRLIERMEEAGCDVEWFREVRSTTPGGINRRTHRKVLVCDEGVAFTGGVGIAREWEGDARGPDEWRDTHFRVRGPAVDGLRAAFLSEWAETGAELFDEHDRFPEQPAAGDSTVQVVRCPSVIGWSEIATVVTGLLRVAQHHVRLTTAYFVPDEHMLRLLTDAAERGVRVEVVVPGEHTDKRIVQIAGEADYEALLEAGVVIHRYAATMIHAKVLTVDGLVACVGSANYDPRSFGLNEEANLVVFDRAVVALLDRHFAEDVERSDRVDPHEWARRGPAQKVAEAVTQILDPQL